MRSFFNDLKNKKLIAGLILGGLLSYLVFMAMVLFLIKDTSEPPKAPRVSSLESDYSRLDEVVPGKTTLEEVKKINGNPKSMTTKGDRAYLYYDTPLEGFTNRVVVKNNTVVYSIEKVFGSYRGSFADYKNKYGEPDLSLFGNNYSWYVYLSQGVAIQNDGRDILTILYFVPQNKEKFMLTIGKELGLTESPESVD